MACCRITKYCSINNKACEIKSVIMSRRMYCIVCKWFVHELLIKLILLQARVPGGLRRDGMADDQFRRADSLPDIRNEGNPAPAGVGLRSGPRGLLSSSLLSLPTAHTARGTGILVHAPSEEEGLSLLIHGSPIRDDDTGVSDEHLLDYDSGGSNRHQLRSRNLVNIWMTEVIWFPRCLRSQTWKWTSPHLEQVTPRRTPLQAVRTQTLYTSSVGPPGLPGIRTHS
jgi:hypothetical protein